MSRLNKSQFAILGWLSKGSMSGYDLKQKFSQTASFFWAESNAQIYPILKQLEKDGKVSSQLDRNSGKRQRRLYAITSEGFHALDAWLQQQIEFSQQREEILLKLSFAEHLSNAALKQHIQHYQQQLEERYQQLECFQRLASQDPYPPTHLDKIVRYAQLTLTAKLQWCKEILDK